MPPIEIGLYCDVCGKRFNAGDSVAWESVDERTAGLKNLPPDAKNVRHIRCKKEKPVMKIDPELVSQILETADGSFGFCLGLLNQLMKRDDVLDKLLKQGHELHTLHELERITEIALDRVQEISGIKNPLLQKRGLSADELIAEAEKMLEKAKSMKKAPHLHAVTPPDDHDNTKK